MNVLDRIKAGTRGVGHGLLAFFTGYVAIYMLKSGEADISGMIPLSGIIDSTLPSTWQVVAWLYLGAHHVELGVSGLSTFGTTLSMQELPMWDGFLLLIPPMALVSAGYGYANRGNFDSVSIRGTIAMAVGYFIAVFGLALASSWSAPMGVGGIFPNFGKVALFASLYPLLFTPIGMFINSRLGDDEGSSSGTPNGPPPQQQPGQQRGNVGGQRHAGDNTAQTHAPPQNQPYNGNQSQHPPQNQQHPPQGYQQQRGQQPPQGHSPQHGQYPRQNQQQPPQEPQQQHGQQQPQERPPQHGQQPPQNQPQQSPREAVPDQDTTDSDIDEQSDDSEVSEVACPNCGEVLPDAPPTTCEECDTAVVPEQ